MRRVLSDDVFSHELEDAPLAAESVISGSPQISDLALHSPPEQPVGVEPASGSNQVDVGLWQLTAGQVVDTEVDEVFVVLAGLGTVEFSDGERIDLRRGVAVRLTAGEKTTWTITQTLRKLYVVLP